MDINDLTPEAIAAMPAGPELDRLVSLALGEPDRDLAWWYTKGGKYYSTCHNAAHEALDRTGGWSSCHADDIPDRPHGVYIEASPFLWQWAETFPLAAARAILARGLAQNKDVE